MSNYLSKHIVNPIRNYFGAYGAKLTPIPKGSKKRYSHKLKHNKEYKFDADQEDLRMAILAAEDSENPKRNLLLAIYRETRRNLHLNSQMRSANFKVISSGWAVVDKKTLEINQDLTQLLQKKWFEDLCHLFLDAEYYGHSLIEFQQLIETEVGWEFNGVKLFPREHTIPEKGHIISDPNSEKGLSYRDSPINEWFIEAGDPNDLGILSPASKHAIYCKYNAGDWGRSGEKFGDPIIDLATDSEDEKELDKKEEYLKNFGNNGYNIHSKDDTTTLLERKNGAGWKIFQGFMDWNEAQMSKGVNGQVGTADEKAYVGSSKIQAELLNEYTKARLRSLMYFINETAIPFLRQVWDERTAYKDLKGHIWMPLKFLPEAEEGEEAEVDGKKSETEEEDKKLGGASNKLGKLITSRQYALSTELDNLYEDECCDLNSDNHLSNEILNTADLDDAVTKAIKRIHSRKLKAGAIDANMVKATADKVWQGAKSGFEKNLTDVKYGSNEHLLKLNLKYNVHVMAVFKNHHNVLAMHELLFDVDGKLKPESQFIKDVQAVNKDYNKNWVKTERNLAKGQSRSASQWIKVQGKGGSIVYIAVMDGRTRPLHAELNGMTYPVEHSVWDKYLPKLGYGCRCWWRWVRRKITKAAKSLPDIPKFFQNNPGKTGKVFNEHHPYFEIAKKNLEQAKKLFGYEPPLILERYAENIATFNKLKKESNVVFISTDVESGGFLSKHKKADKKDLPKNEKSGKVLAKKGYGTQILEHVKTGNIKNPELKIQGIVSDLKTPNSAKGIKNAFNNARKQAVNHLVIQIDSKWKLTDLIKGLDDGFHYNSTINEVLLIRGKEVIRVSREDWQLDRLNDLIKK